MGTALCVSPRKTDRNRTNRMNSDNAEQEITDDLLGAERFSSQGDKHHNPLIPKDSCVADGNGGVPMSDHNDSEYSDSTLDAFHSTDYSSGFGKNWKIDKLIRNNKPDHNIHTFTACKLLGKGSHGRLYLVKDVHDGKFVLKSISRRLLCLLSYDVKEDEENLVKLMNLYHINLIHLEHIFKLDNIQKLYLVSEYYQSTPICDIKENHPKNYFWGIYDGISGLHQNNLIHGNLKLSNIRVTELGAIKLSDYGLNRLFLDKNSNEILFIDSLIYYPPELHKNRCISDFSSDVWALGIILYYLTVHKMPYEGSSLLDLIREISNKPIFFPPETDLALVGLIVRLLNPDHNSRIEFKDIPQDNWILGTIGRRKFESFPILNDEKTIAIGSNVFPIKSNSKKTLHRISTDYKLQRRRPGSCLKICPSSGDVFVFKTHPRNLIDMKTFDSVQIGVYVFDNRYYLLNLSNQLPLMPEFNNSSFRFDDSTYRKPVDQSASTQPINAKVEMKIDIIKQFLSSSSHANESEVFPRNIYSHPETISRLDCESSREQDTHHLFTDSKNGKDIP